VLSWFSKVLSAVLRGGEKTFFRVAGTQRSQKTFFSSCWHSAELKNFFFGLLALSGAKKLFFRAAGTQRSQKNFFSGFPSLFSAPAWMLQGRRGGENI